MLGWAGEKGKHMVQNTRPGTQSLKLKQRATCVKQILNILSYILFEDITFY